MKYINKYFSIFVDWMIGYIRYLFSGIRLKQTVVTLVTLLGSIGLMIFLYNYWIDVAKIGIMSVVAAIGIMFLTLVDVVVLKDIDTYEAIRDKNLAYMGYMLCVSIIISSCILAFFR